MKKDSEIYIPGHNGMVGSAIARELERKGYTNIITNTLDLRHQDNTRWYIDTMCPEYVFNCAAHAGGILEAINHPAEMLIDNIRIQNNVIEACHKYKVKKLLNLGSSCVYPVNGEQPYKEEQLGEGKTDENWSYAVAKLAGIELCRAYHRQYGCNFITAIPCNLYGPNDNFGENGHVIPSLIRKFHEANGEPVGVWGDGTARREFLYVDDFAEAAVMLMEKYDYEDLHDGVINIGAPAEVEIETVVTLISAMSGCKDWEYRQDKPNGIPSKRMDSSRIHKLGWYPKTLLADGIKKTYDWYMHSSRY